MQQHEIHNLKRDYLTEELGSFVNMGGAVLKTKALYEMGFTDRMISEFIKSGQLRRLKNGYYCPVSPDITQAQIISELFPDGVLCMESALYAYHYIEERPLKWCIAIDKDTSKSRFSMEYPMVKPYYAESKVLSFGVSEIELDGFSFKIYDKERLICEILRFETQLEPSYVKAALLSYVKESNKNIAHLLQYAKERKVITKVRNTIGLWL